MLVNGTRYQKGSNYYATCPRPLVDWWKLAPRNTGYSIFARSKRMRLERCSPVRFAPEMANPFKVVDGVFCYVSHFCVFRRFPVGEREKSNDKSEWNSEHRGRHAFTIQQDTFFINISTRTFARKPLKSGLKLLTKQRGKKRSRKYVHVAS